MRVTEKTIDRRPKDAGFDGEALEGYYYFASLTMTSGNSMVMAMRFPGLSIESWQDAYRAKTGESDR
jgi:hypothetical protein